MLLSITEKEKGMKEEAKEAGESENGAGKRHQEAQGSPRGAGKEDSGKPE